MCESIHKKTVYLIVPKKILVKLRTVQKKLAHRKDCGKSVSAAYEIISNGPTNLYLSSKRGGKNWVEKKHLKNK